MILGKGIQTFQSFDGPLLNRNFEWQEAGARSKLATGGTWEPAQIRRHLETAPIFIF